MCWTTSQSKNPSLVQQRRDFCLCTSSSSPRGWASATWLCPHSRPPFAIRFFHPRFDHLFHPPLSSQTSTSTCLTVVVFVIVVIDSSDVEYTVDRIHRSCHQGLKAGDVTAQQSLFDFGSACDLRTKVDSRYSGLDNGRRDLTIGASQPSVATSFRYHRPEPSSSASHVQYLLIFLSLLTITIISNSLPNHRIRDQLRQKRELLGAER